MSYAHISLWILLHHHFLDPSWDLSFLLLALHISFYSFLILISSSSSSLPSHCLSFLFSFIYWKSLFTKNYLIRPIVFWHLIIFYCSLSSPLMIISDTSRKTDILLHNTGRCRWLCYEKTLGKWVKFNAYFCGGCQTQNAADCAIPTMWHSEKGKALG